MTQLFHVRLTKQQAYALANVAKRIAWEQVRDLATSEAEISEIFGGFEGLRAALAEEGVHVR